MAEFISTAEAAERLGTTRQTITLYLRKGVLRGLKLGKQWRIHREDFERLLTEPPAAERREEPQQAV